MQAINHKRGDTFEVSGTLTNADTGTPISLATCAVTSMVRGMTGGLVEILAVTITDAAAGEFTATANAAAVQDWPVGTLYCDIQFAFPDSTVSSETFEVRCLEDITRG